jgi:hypothetical protein
VSYTFYVITGRLVTKRFVIVCFVGAPTHGRQRMAKGRFSGERDLELLLFGPVFELADRSLKGGGGTGQDMFL